VGEPLALRLATWLAGLAWSDVPPRQQELARLRLLDTLGLVLGACDFPAGVIARARAVEESGHGGASLVGLAAAVPAGWAALAHGVMAHVFDYDDTFPDSVVHPGSAIIPVALALGEELGASGAEILTAIAGAYEICARLARVGGRSFHQRGLHPSGIFAPLSAACVAARLMRLAPERMAEALGLAASMSGGLMAFIEEGSWSKMLHLGWGGFGGILAAQLARGGFRGPSGALDGRNNLYGAFLAGVPVALDGIDDGLGSQWHSDTALFKLYPCAHVNQPYLDLVLGLRRSEGITPQQVRRVTCRVAPFAIPIVCQPVAQKLAPRNMAEAGASLPYLLAAALVDGEVGLDTMGDAALARPEIRDLARRVTYVAAPDLAGFGAALEIELTDGRRFAVAGTAAAADAVRLGEKFRTLAARALPPDRIALLAEAVADFAGAPDASQIGALLRAATPH
jgi:2-methylcitrate dehydratase PrpD